MKLFSKATIAQYLIQPSLEKSVLFCALMYLITSSLLAFVSLAAENILHTREMLAPTINKCHH